ncbi:MAG: ribosome silencing factor [Flavobacteriales bacterium]
MSKKKNNYTKQLVDTIIDGMQEVKANDIVCLDLKEIPNSITDYFVICHGDSSTQVESIAKSVEKVTSEQLNEKPFHKEGTQNSLWILMDYISIMVHIFYKDTRDHYDLESLWSDALTIKIEE